MMKNKNLYYGIGTIGIIAFAAMKILHMPHANTVLIISFLFIHFVQHQHINYLENKLKATSQNQQGPTATWVPEQPA